MSGQLIDIELERRDAIVLVILSGEIDMSNAASVRKQIAEFVTSRDEAVVIDLSNISFMDSAGLHVLVELGAVLTERRQRLLVSALPGSQVERTIEIVGMERTIPLHPDREAAMEAARASDGELRPIGPDEA